MNNSNIATTTIMTANEWKNSTEAEKAKFVNDFKSLNGATAINNMAFLKKESKSFTDFKQFKTNVDNVSANIRNSRNLFDTLIASSIHFYYHNANYQVNVINHLIVSYAQNVSIPEAKRLFKWLKQGLPFLDVIGKDSDNPFYLQQSGKKNATLIPTFGKTTDKNQRLSYEQCIARLRESGYWRSFTEQKTKKSDEYDPLSEGRKAFQSVEKVFKVLSENTTFDTSDFESRLNELLNDYETDLQLHFASVAHAARSVSEHAETKGE